MATNLTLTARYAAGRAHDTRRGGRTMSSCAKRWIPRASLRMTRRLRMTWRMDAPAGAERGKRGLR